RRPGEAMSFTSGLPPIDQSQLPAGVRNATPARKQAYEAGLGFEQLLVQQLSQSLVDSTNDTSSDDGTDSTGSTGGLGGGSPYASLLPDALSQGVMSAGGLGLARQLMDAIQPATPAAPGASAPTTGNADRAGGAGEDDSASLLAERLTRRQDP